MEQNFPSALLANIPTSEEHENVFLQCLPLNLPLPISFQDWTHKGHPHDLDSPWLDSHSCKNVLRLHISACWPDVYHQFTWQVELLSLGLHCTHLHFSLAFQTSLDFCQPWHFSVTMYFSDSLIEGKWSLALFNSDIASGPQTDVCHCSFYFRGSGMHKAWEMALSSSSA